MMAEQLGSQIAKAGGLGLQKILSRHWAARFEQAQSSDAIAARPRDM
jgi:hypothetical protein